MEPTFPTDITTTPYAALLNVNYHIALLPWGATEPHNLHLPYATDTLLSERIAIEAANKVRQEGVKCMVLPAVPFGSQNIGQWNKPFCIHTSYETQRALLGDIVASLYRQGLRKLLIVNGHGGNCFKNMVRDLNFLFPDFEIAVCDYYAIVPQQGYFENKDDHAGEMETSLMLHFYPHLVDITLAGEGVYAPFNIEGFNKHIAWIPRPWDRASCDTGIGNPCRSSSQKGELYTAEILSLIASLLHDWATHPLYK